VLINDPRCGWYRSEPATCRTTSNLSPRPPLRDLLPGLVVVVRLDRGEIDGLWTVAFEQDVVSHTADGVQCLAACRKFGSVSCDTPSSGSGRRSACVSSAGSEPTKCGWRTRTMAGTYAIRTAFRAATRSSSGMGPQARRPASNSIGQVLLSLLDTPDRSDRLGRRLRLSTSRPGAGVRGRLQCRQARTWPRW
jgi:hypothetical protein